MIKLGLKLAERGWLPDAPLRWGIRQLLARRIRFERGMTPENHSDATRAWIKELKNSPIALETDKANEQHYEVPPEFFEPILGPRRKYSCALYPEGGETLDEAEERMLALSCERAALRDGMDILELGCGWGSLTLYMAQKYPNSRITAVSNSASQRVSIEARCQELGLGNVRVVTVDMNDFATEDRFDRVVSVEMFEHMRNYELLLGRISEWLKPGGALFTHIFCHRTLCYPFETVGAVNWMGRYFFTGGQMPSADLLMFFQRDLALEERWFVDGTHYARTCRQWLQRMDANQARLTPILARTYGEDQVERWRNRWRIFFMACEELFAYHGGREWFVAHYRFVKR